MRDLINLIEDKLSFHDAKGIMADIEHTKGRIREIAGRNPWLIEACQKAVREQIGNSFSVYRTVLLTDGLKAEEIVSTSLNFEVVYTIADDAPSLLTIKNQYVKTTKTFLHYKITPANVVLWIPFAMQFVRAALGKRTNHNIEDRYGTPMKMQTILNWLDEHDEEEIVADVRGIAPKVISFPGHYQGNEMRSLFRDFMRGKMSPSSEQYALAYGKGFPELLQQFRNWAA